jgi:hypothetical protein
MCPPQQQNAAFLFCFFNFSFFPRKETTQKNKMDAEAMCQPYMQYLGSLSAAMVIEQVEGFNSIEKRLAYLQTLKKRWEKENPQPAPQPQELPEEKAPSESSTSSKSTQRKRFLFHYTVATSDSRINPETLRTRFAFTGIRNLVDIPRDEQNPTERIVLLATIKRTTVNRVNFDMQALFGFHPDYTITQEDREALATAANNTATITDDDDRAAVEKTQDQGSVLERVNALEILVRKGQERIAALEEVLFGEEKPKKKKQKKQGKDDSIQ